MKNKTKLKVFGAGIITMLLFSCAEPSRPYSEEMTHNEPGIQFMDDMYPSRAYETYGENSKFNNNMASREPVKGTIPRGFIPYPYPNTPEGYAMAGDSLQNPIALSDDVLAQGEDLYTKFCVHCHGETGNGDGSIIANGKFPPPPSYSTGASSGGGDMKDLPAGKMFHTITYGKNLMGSHASQLTKAERWKIIHFIQTLQNPEPEDETTDAEEVAVQDKGENEK